RSAIAKAPLSCCSMTTALLQLQNELQRQQQQAGEGLARELRGEIHTSAQNTRQELGANFIQFQQALAAQLTSVATLQNKQIDSFAQQLAQWNAASAQQMEAMR